MGKFTRLYRTVKYLKARQIYYRLFYLGRSKWRKLKGFEHSLPVFSEPLQLELTFCDEDRTFYRNNLTFEFLNQRKTFRESIDWNFIEYGKLWNYNLLYFDFLQQTEVSLGKKRTIITDFIDHFDSISLAKDPYPISLRCINWIKFLIKNNVSDERIEHSVYYQYYLLLDNIEYHLMGNHLFENGCSLLIGGLFFDDEILLGKARDILINQINEQILDDGGHFERSPMYHQILLYRLLDCLNFLAARPQKAGDLQNLVREKVEAMCGWLKKMTFSDGSIPYVNDAAKGIAPDTNHLLKYADKLEISALDALLKDSGYRMVRDDSWEWLIDVGDVGPDYIPGHAHSDTFSFVLHVDEKPIVVDTGISTYEENERRVAERSTAAHNTVKIDDVEQTEVWKSFRVGRRAHITHLQETANSIVAEHDGYRHLGAMHQRTFEWSKKKLTISDCIKTDKDVKSTAFFHFHPAVNVQKKADEIWADNIKLSFSEFDKLEMKKYRYAVGFNRLETATVLEIAFQSALKTEIIL